MWSTVLALAAAAAADTVRVATVAVLFSSKRPMRSVFAFWLAGLTTGVGIGAIILFALPSVAYDHLQSTGSAVGGWISGPKEIALGVAVIAISAVVGLRGRRWNVIPETPLPAPLPVPLTGDTWTTRLRRRSTAALDRGMLWVAVLLGCGSATPVPYFIALAAILQSAKAPAEQVGAVVAFNLISLSSAAIPLIGNAIAPDRTGALIDATQRWIRANHRSIVVCVLVLIGLILIKNGLGI